MHSHLFEITEKGDRIKSDRWKMIEKFLSKEETRYKTDQPTHTGSP